MTDLQFQNQLIALLEEQFEASKVVSYKSADILTDDRGAIVTLDGGQKFFITITSWDAPSEK